MTENQLRERTKQFALRVMKLVDALPNTRSGRAIANQLVRSGTSIGANYRAACRARSKRDFISKLGIVEEEADESGYWLELIIDGGLLSRRRAGSLLTESEELTKIMTSSRLTAARSDNQKSKIKNQK